MQAKFVSPFCTISANNRMQSCCRCRRRRRRGPVMLSEGVSGHEAPPSPGNTFHFVKKKKERENTSRFVLCLVPFHSPSPEVPSLRLYSHPYRGLAQSAYMFKIYVILDSEFLHDGWSGFPGFNFCERSSRCFRSVIRNICLRREKFGPLVFDIRKAHFFFVGTRVIFRKFSLLMITRRRRLSLFSQ